MRHLLSRCGLPPALVVLSAVVLAAQSAPPATGARPNPSQEQPPTFRTGTNFVRVDVYPMQDGRPLPGLRVEDFEIFEDGARQTIETFEYISITPAGPQATRQEPSSTRDALQEAADPRARVFIIFLDTPNVSVEGSHRIREPLVRLLDRILGPDDLAAIMTPAMAASDITLARKTVVIEQQLRDKWGTRHSIVQRDLREEAYLACYPPLPSEKGVESKLARAMIARKRERASLEALEDLVRWLHGIREERKAIITVTEGWLLHRPDQELMRLRKDPVTGQQESIPGIDDIVVGRHGTLRTRDDRRLDSETLSKRECDTDRLRLANMDNEWYFRDIIAQANRANATFYPIDPRGLAVWDAPLGPEAPPPLPVDQANLRTRLESLHNLAVGTDGLAVVSSNDLDKGLERIAADLTSYYLLGYHSTNTKLDGRYRRLEVKVKRPGVDVRARRGYRAPTAEEVAAAEADAYKVEAAPSALKVAMGMLARIRPDAGFRVNAASAPAGDAGVTVWVAGELLRGGGTDSTAAGGTADIEVRVDEASNTSQVTLKPGERGFVTPVTVPAFAERVQVRVRFSADGSVVPLTDAVEVSSGQPLLFRRGPSTGNREVPAADFRFSRTERLHLELPVATGAQPTEAKLLDANGQPLKVPVKAGLRTDATGQHWLTADVTLAPLAAADYAIELTWTVGGETRQSVTAFRVTR